MSEFLGEEVIAVGRRGDFERRLLHGINLLLNIYQMFFEKKKNDCMRFP